MYVQSSFIYPLSSVQSLTSIIYSHIFKSCLFFENQPNEICSHLSENASKGRFLKPVRKEKERRKRKNEKKERGEEKKKKWQPEFHPK